MPPHLVSGSQGSTPFSGHQGLITCLTLFVTASTQHHIQCIDRRMDNVSKNYAAKRALKWSIRWAIPEHWYLSVMNRRCARQWAARRACRLIRWPGMTYDAWRCRAPSRWRGASAAPCWPHTRRKPTRSTRPRQRAVGGCCSPVSFCTAALQWVIWHTNCAGQFWCGARGRGRCGGRLLSTSQLLQLLALGTMMFSDCGSSEKLCSLRDAILHFWGLSVSPCALLICSKLRGAPLKTKDCSSQIRDFRRSCAQAR